VTVSQSASSLTVQLTFELTVKLDWLLAAEPRVMLVVDTSRVAADPFCVTLIFLDPTPVPLTVTAALRALVEVLALVAVTVTAPLFIPL
jgi:hypothetical protein